SELSPQQLADYEAALQGTDPKFLRNNRSAIESQVWRSIDSLLDRRIFERDELGKLTFEANLVPDEEIALLFRNEFLLDPELEDIINWNLMDIAHEYMSTTGFEVLAWQTVQRMEGIPNLSPDEFFDAMEAVAMKGLVRGEGDVTRVRAGMDQLRAKWWNLNGMTPRPVAEAEGIGEFFGELGVNLAAAFHGLFIGILNLGTEVLKESLSRIHSWQDFGDNIFNIFRLAGSAEARREALQDMELAVRINRHNSYERFTSGLTGSAFHYNITEKFTMPWLEVWEAARGRVLPGGRIRGRAANTAIAGTKALANTIMLAGGTDYFTNLARAMAATTLKRETAR
ncbi:MAG: hypothetical protein L0312_11395, partial [Acidobacteria bacterium]|nr:hypothetical protein [Acidobacteriota bacterium]